MALCDALITSCPGQDYEYPAADSSTTNSARCYTPSQLPSEQTVGIPLVLYIHGGGWCLNDARTQPYDAVCSELAADLGCIVLSLNYRLAPEHPYPAAVEVR